MRHNNTLTLVSGNNFSGRSEHIKHACENAEHSVFLGEIPSHFISGIAPTVSEELRLYSHNTPEAIRSILLRFLNDIGFTALSRQNPFTLSGGEQVILNIVGALFSTPGLLGIDTALEQLSMEWKRAIFQLLDQIEKTKVIIADNRVDEYDIKYQSVAPRVAKYEHPLSINTPDFQELDFITEGVPVQIKGLSFAYKQDTPILKDVDLALIPGNIYFLRGINGSGKTTLAKILAGILKCKEGAICRNDQTYDPYYYPGQLFGYCFQNPDEQLFSRTIRAEILGKNIRPDSMHHRRAVSMIKMFGLQDLVDKHPAEMPFVIRKRISIAATLATDRPWYILDEPTIGQDNQFSEFLARLFRNLISAGKGLIIITHSRDFHRKFKGKPLYLKDRALTAE